MRWLGGLGRDKCGGGWFDPYGTRPPTYIEQARQTVLAGACESVLLTDGLIKALGDKVELKASNVHTLAVKLSALLLDRQKFTGCALSCLSGAFFVV